MRGRQNYAPSLCIRRNLGSERASELPRSFQQELARTGPQPKFYLWETRSLPLPTPPGESSPESPSILCTSLAPGCFVMTGSDSISKAVLDGTTVSVRVGFGGSVPGPHQRLSVFTVTRGPSVVRCVTSNLLLVIVKVLKFQMNCFYLETGALSRFIPMTLSSTLPLTLLNGRTRGRAIVRSLVIPCNLSLPSVGHSPWCSVIGILSIVRVCDE